MPHAEAVYFDDANYDAMSGIIDICKWVDDGADYSLWQLEKLASRIQALISSTDRSCDFIFIDYPFAYRQPQIAPLIDYAIYIDTPLDIAMARRILRDFTSESGRKIREDIQGYLARGRLAYLHMVETIMPDSDFIVDGSWLIDDIVNTICLKLEEIKGSLPSSLC